MFDDQFEQFGIESDTSGNIIQFKSLSDLNFIMNRYSISPKDKYSPLRIPISPNINMLSVVKADVENNCLQILGLKFSVTCGNQSETFLTQSEAEAFLDQAIVINKIEKL